MNRQSLSRSIALAVAFFLTLTSQTALALYAPESQSGGRFFQSKGTMSSEDYEYLGRTGTRGSQDYYYGQGLRAGNVNIRPRASYTREWDSNIFLTRDGAKSDWINRLDWGIDATAPFDDGKYVLYSGVQSASEWFNRHDDQNHTDWIYQGGGQANFNHFSLQVFEDFRRTVDRSDTELTDRVDRKENYLNGILTIPFASFFSETEFSHYYLKFREPEREASNRQEFRTSPRLGMDIGGRTQALVEYSVTPIDYYSVDQDLDGLDNEWAAGLRGFLGSGDLVSYQAWLGWEIRNYDSSSRKDFNSVVFRGDVRWRPSEFSELIAEFDRRPEESVSETNSYLVWNDLGLRYRHKVTDYGMINVGGKTSIADYSSSRSDFYWQAFIKGEVLLPGKFASLFGEYRFRQRKSNEGINSYCDQIANFGVKVEL